MLYVNYKFKKINEFQFKVEYSVRKTKLGRVLKHEDDYMYSPMNAEFSMWTARRKIMHALRMRLKKFFPDENNYSFNCENDMSDFAERNCGNKNSSVVPTLQDNERVYEVINVGEVWFIRKHDTPFYTEEQAKTVLMQKILNGGK